MIAPSTIICFVPGKPDANRLDPVRKNSVDKTKPKCIPMHRAHSGIWNPSKMYDLSGSWWQTVEPRNMRTDSKVTINPCMHSIGINDYLFESSTHTKNRFDEKEE
jgi:hypothetical protein